MTKDDIASVKRAVREINITAQMFETTQSKIDPKNLIGIRGFSLERVLEFDPEFLKEEEVRTAYTSLPRPTPPHLPPTPRSTLVVAGRQPCGSRPWDLSPEFVGTDLLPPLAARSTLAAPSARAL